MEGVAIGIAKKALDSVVSTATTAITDRIGLLLGVQEELFFIKEELEMMQAFLRVASAEEVKGEIVRTWVKQVQELSYDVEDCLQEASIHLMKKGCLNAISSYKTRARIARTIKVLKVRIEDVSMRSRRYGFIKKSSNKNVIPDFMNKPVPCLVANEKPFVVGLSKPKEEVLKRTFENLEAWKVISIVGMGGRGKTTLVRNVYESPELRNQFQCLAWITILHPFSMEEFVISLARELSLLHQDEKTRVMKKWRFDMEELKTKINEHMKDKKYAIVLDDLASETEWKTIRGMFPNEDKGSRFLVTTRSDDLAKSISTEHGIYRFPELSIEESLELFYKAVYKNSNYILVTDGKYNCKLRKSRSFSLSTTKEGEQPDKSFQLQRSFVYSDLQQEITPPKQVPVDLLVTEEMQIQANTIIERSGKLPLAIVAIGSFLATRPKTSDEWKKMHEHISSEIHNNPHLESIMNVLSTSYNGLPYYLKSCFLYLSVFHNHCNIRRSRIVRRWMAEGFLEQRRDMTAEEVGEHYFYELIGRSLIESTNYLRIDNQVIKKCKIHDLLYEMIVAKSENENVVSFVRDQSTMNVSSKARHVVFQDGLEEKNNALGNMNLSNIRSVTMFRKVGAYVVYHKMRLLRVLDLEGTLGLKNRDIKKIGELRHLKYLGLRGTKISKLPDSLEDLHELETLDIRNTLVLELPRGIIKLQKLSYLHAGFDRRMRYDLYEMFKPALSVKIQTFFSSLSTLLSDVAAGDTKRSWGDFVWCITHPLWWRTDLYGLKPPRGVGNMRSMCNLGIIDIGQSNGLAKELQRLSNLTKAKIVGFSKENGKILGEAFESLIHLRSLFLEALDTSGLSCCLESIKSPPNYLKSLKLFSPVKKIPDWFRSLENLVKLYFRNTKLKMEDIRVIENLPNLKILAMLENSFAGDAVLCFGPNSFPMLHVLVLNNIRAEHSRRETIEVLIEKTALQKVSYLSIKDSESYILNVVQVKRREKGEEGLVPRWELRGLENLEALKEVRLVDLNVDVVKSVKGMISMIPNKPEVRCVNIPTKAEESV